MISTRTPEETLEFANDAPILLNYKNSASYIDKNVYDRSKMTQGFVWHQIVVHHRGKFSQRSIFEALFQAVGDEEFFPMVYEEGAKADRFFVRQCQGALDKLFSKNLYLYMANGTTIKLEVVLNVAEYKYGQISPTKRIEKALEGLFKTMEKGGILNLSEFARNPEFKDIAINLKNKAVFDVLSRSIFRNEDQFRRVNGMRLKNNKITSLQPMKAFNGCEFDILDLSGNQLNSATRIYKELKEIKMEELFLEGNPVTEGEDYPLNMKNLFANFTKLDGKTIEELRTIPMQTDKDDESSEGKLIDPMKPNRMKKYENDDNWNSITIPNRKKYSKRQLLDAFFNAFPPELSEIYPCNYKENSTEHTFFVRECYDHLKYLVYDCKLQIPAPDPDDEMLTIQLTMNVKSFDSDPLIAIKAITKAIEQRFIAKERLLDLEDFNSATGIQGVEIDLRSPKILNRVLTQAGNRYSKKIFELRLGKNRIRSCNFAKPFVQMFRLKVLDLSHNNLKDFSDFMELEKLPIKSLNLDGNPLCDLYSYAPEYIKAALSLFPDLTKLDGVEISTQNTLTTKKNFLCDIDGYDLVDQFVTHYFTLFESDNRLILKEMYHPKAILSMTCNYSMSNLSASNTKRVSRYTNLSRNILKMSDFSRAMGSLHSGCDEICQALAAIPNVEHDIVGFTTDTTTYNENMVTITITGVLKDLAPSPMDPDILIAFCRTFVLTPVVKNAGILKCATEYQIINDIFSLTNPSQLQLQNSFKFTPNPVKPATKVSADEKEGLLVMFQEVTMLKTIWCRRFLDDGYWDFKRSLAIFLEEGQKNSIPEAAFSFV